MIEGVAVSHLLRCQFCCVPLYTQGALGNVGGTHVDCYIAKIVTPVRARDKPIRRSLNGYA